MSTAITTRCDYIERSRARSWLCAVPRLRAKVDANALLGGALPAVVPDIAERTSCGVAQNGEVPALEMRRHWRIRPIGDTELDQWIDAQPGGGEGSGRGG